MARKPKVDRDRILAMHRQGMRFSDIGREVGLSGTHVSRIVRSSDPRWAEDYRAKATAMTKKWYDRTRRRTPDDGILTPMQERGFRLLNGHAPTATTAVADPEGFVEIDDDTPLAFAPSVLACRNCGGEISKGELCAADPWRHYPDCDA